MMTSLSDHFRSPLLNASLHPDATSFVMVEWIADPAPAGTREEIAPYHVHHHDDEAWYVLEGTLGFRFDGEECEIPAGGAAFATSGTAHTYWNAGSTPARYLLVMTPRIQALIASLHDPARAGQSLSEKFAAFDSALVSP
jgi:hypothetical protein